MFIPDIVLVLAFSIIQYCMYETDSSQNMYSGMSLPYSEGGLIPDTCIGCYSQNYENYEWEVSDMCRRTIEDASYRCEENMDKSNLKEIDEHELLLKLRTTRVFCTKAIKLS